MIFGGLQKQSYKLWWVGGLRNAKIAADELQAASQQFTNTYLPTLNLLNPQENANRLDFMKDSQSFSSQKKMKETYELLDQIQILSDK